MVGLSSGHGISPLFGRPTLCNEPLHSSAPSEPRGTLLGAPPTKGEDVLGVAKRSAPSLILSALHTLQFDASFCMLPRRYMLVTTCMRPCLIARSDRMIGIQGESGRRGWATGWYTAGLYCTKCTLERGAVGKCPLKFSDARALRGLISNKKGGYTSHLANILIKRPAAVLSCGSMKRLIS